MKVKQLAKRVRKALAGFSLVEMLVVIAVIGVITAVAVPAISSITSEAENAKIARNAQNIASVYNAAIAAGATLNGLSETDESAAIDTLQGGVNGSGSFANAEFLVDITDAEQTKAEAQLTLNNGIMTY